MKNPYFKYSKECYNSKINNEGSNNLKADNLLFDESPSVRTSDSGTPIMSDHHYQTGPIDKNGQMVPGAILGSSALMLGIDPLLNSPKIKDESLNGIHAGHPPLTSPHVQTLSTLCPPFPEAGITSLTNGKDELDKSK